MVITKEQTGEEKATLKIQFSEEDYKVNVDKTLKEYQRKANMPGFRPGKVPAGIINKLYGKAATIDEIDKLLNRWVYDYIKENKIEILGSPIPNEELNTTLDIDSQKEFDFYFDLALAPEVDPVLDEKVKVTEYNIIISDEDITDYIENIRLRMGEHTTPETTGENDLIFVEISEVEKDPKTPEEKENKNATIYLERVEDTKTKESLTGLKVDDTCIVSAKKLSKDEAELSRIFGVKKEDVAALNAKYQLKVRAISRIVKPEINEELFNKVYPNVDITDEDNFRQKIKEELERLYKPDGEYQLYKDVINQMIKKYPISLADELLKKFIKLSSEKKDITDEQIENEYPRYQEVLKRDIIESSIARKNDIKVTEDDAKEYVKNDIDKYFTGKSDAEGQTDEDLEKTKSYILDSYMKNEKEMEKIYGMLVQKRLVSLFREKISIKTKDVSIKEYKDILQTKDQ